jgi:MFS family permease
VTRQDHGIAPPWGLAIALFFVNTLSFIDRQLLTLLVGPIRADLQISDTQMSLLQGLAFASFYALLGLPLGRLADRADRPKLIAGGVGLWSAMTAFCGLASSYLFLFIGRMGVAVGEAVLSPAAISLLSERFPRTLIARAIAIFQSGIFVGSALALLAGGALLNLVTSAGGLTVPGYGDVTPWRAVFIIVSLPGILAAIMMMFVWEPRRATSVQARPPQMPLRAALDWMWHRRSLYGWHFAAFTLITILAYGIMAWMPTILIRLHGVPTGTAGIWLGIILMVTGPLGVYCGGYFVDLYLGRGAADAPIRVVAFGIILLGISVPIYALSTSVPMALIAVTLVCAAQAFPYGIAASSLTLVTPPEMRGQVIAVYLLISNLIGLTSGPLIVARLTDGYFGYDKAIGQSLALLPILTVPFALFCLYYCAPAYAKAWIAKQGEGK